MTVTSHLERAGKALWVVMGLAIAFNAVSWGLGFLGYSGGLLV